MTSGTHLDHGMRVAIRASVVAVLAAGVIPARAAEEPPQRNEETGRTLGRAAAPAPRFKVKDLSGRTLDLEVLRRGGPVLLDFWATWCKPCHAALPELEAWHEKYGPLGLTVIGVSVDGPRNYSKVRPFVSRMGITYSVVVDQDGRIQQLYQAIALPTAVLIDRDGTIAAVRVGYRPGESGQLEEKIRALLARASDAGAPAADSASGTAPEP